VFQVLVSEFLEPGHAGGQQGSAGDNRAELLLVTDSWGSAQVRRRAACDSAGPVTEETVIAIKRPADFDRGSIRLEC
jgi:hypothetical protein